MQFRAMFTAVILAVAALAAVPALAAVQTVNLSGVSAIGSLNPLSLGDGANVFGSSDQSGTFQHFVTFSTAKAGTVSIGATPNNSVAPLFDLGGLTYTVLDLGNNSIVGSAFASDILTFAATAGGNYVLALAGNVKGLIGGNYAGAVALTPIPGALLLLGPALAGLGYVGVRRRQNAAA